MKALTSFFSVVGLSFLIVGGAIAIPQQGRSGQMFPSTTVNLRQFFPTEKGTDIEIDIEIGKVGPVVSRIFRYDNENITMAVEQKSTLVIEEGSMFRLEMEVGGEIQVDGNMAVAVKILKDELALFHGATAVAWMLKQEPPFAVFQVLVSEKAGEEALFSVSPIFTAGALESKNGQGSFKLIGYEDEELHMVRVTESTGPKVDNSCTEHYYYKKWIGLIRMVQKRHGVTSMTWTRVFE